MHINLLLLLLPATEVPWGVVRSFVRSGSGHCILAAAAAGKEGNLPASPLPPHYYERKASIHIHGPSLATAQAQGMFPPPDPGESG